MTMTRSQTMRDHNPQAQRVWQSKNHNRHTIAQQESPDLAKLTAKRGGDYYRIEVRPSKEFSTFRYHDVGDPGKILRLAGKRANGGAWDDQAWLIDKNMAHVDGDELVADDPEARNLLKVIGPVKHLKGDIFLGHPRYKVPKLDDPTPAQRKAQRQNIKRAQASRRYHH
jgi:hypothetical protein